jgi:ZIP family zinc transporter
MFGLAGAVPGVFLLALVGAGTGAATVIGGALALKARQHIRLLLGFSAGAVIAVALFDLLPEALALAGKAHPPPEVFGFVAAGFAAYMVIDRAFLAVSADGRTRAGHLGPASLTTHSFLDGLGVGLAFHVSPGAGLVLALAVLAHDVSDGVNTVNLSLSAAGSPRTARLWLFADACAPILGIAAAQAIHVDPATLGVLLALFAGIFLYIGASELVPESHHRHPHLWTSIATVLGMALIYLAVRLAGG